jgi:hypothetical protein
MPFTGPIAVILKVLIEKKFSLPERVIQINKLGFG